MIIPSKLFDVLKWMTLILIPAIVAAVINLGDLWALPNAGKIAGTIAIFNTVLGVAIGVSAIKYNASDEKYDGVIDPMTANSQTSENALRLSTDEYDAANQKEVLLKVKQNPVIPEY